MSDLRSSAWFQGKDHPSMTAVYLERLLNYGITPDELTAGKPIIGIAQTGSDLSPCNYIHLSLEKRIRDGVRDAGGIPLVFPTHPIQESCRRPTAAIDRNLAYLSLVEVLYGFPIDGVVLTTGCDKTTPACLMAAATVNCPSIVLSGGPMLDAEWEGTLAGSGYTLWEARRLYAAGEIDVATMIDMVAATCQSAGHCNTMGTALSMNSLAEALGMSLPGCAAIPAPYRQRPQMAYETGRRIVQMVHEGLTPDQILTRHAFENAIIVNTAIGGSTNCPPHINALAAHAGVSLEVKEWQTIGYEVPLLVNLQPAGKFLGESYFRAGGVSAVLGELMEAGRIHEGALTVTGRTLGENVGSQRSRNLDVIKTYEKPIRENSGFLVLSGNLFDSALIKTSVISAEFRNRYLSEPGNENCFTARAIVFDGPEDYRARLNDPELAIDERCMLVVRGAGPIGFPGSGEVVNMQPPDALIREGVNELACLGDGRQSGTSGCPAILNASPESAAGGGLAILRTGDEIRVDLNSQRVDLLLDDSTIKERWEAYVPEELVNDTPWEELYRATVGQLGDGACIRGATKYRNLARMIPRHSH